MKWNKAYADVGKMKQALKEGGCDKDEIEKSFVDEDGWHDVLVMRHWEHPERHFSSHDFFVASYYVSKGKGFWSSKVFLCKLLSEQEVCDTDMWTVIEIPKEDKI